MTASWAGRWCIVKASGLMSGSEASLGGRLMSGIFGVMGGAGGEVCLLSRRRRTSKKASSISREDAAIVFET
jgi:hypothetical protein